jgi:hypothetical protein
VTTRAVSGPKSSRSSAESPLLLGVCAPVGLLSRRVVWRIKSAEAGGAPARGGVDALRGAPRGEVRRVLVGRAPRGLVHVPAEVCLALSENRHLLVPRWGVGGGGRGMEGGRRRTGR